MAHKYAVRITACASIIYRLRLNFGNVGRRDVAYTSCGPTRVNDGDRSVSASEIRTLIADILCVPSSSWTWRVNVLVSVRFDRRINRITVAANDAFSEITCICVKFVTFFSPYIANNLFTVLLGNLFRKTSFVSRTFKI